MSKCQIFRVANEELNMLVETPDCVKTERCDRYMWPRYIQSAYGMEQTRRRKKNYSEDIMPTAMKIVAHSTPPPTVSQLRAKRRALVTLHVRYVREAMAATDTDARRAAFESAHDIDHALRAIDDRLFLHEPPPATLDLHERIYDM